MENCINQDCNMYNPTCDYNCLMSNEGMKICQGYLTAQKEPVADVPLQCGVRCATRTQDYKEQNMKEKTFEEYWKEEAYSGGRTPEAGSEEIARKAWDARDQASSAKPQNTDNWKHRDKGMKCLTCMWYAFKERENLQPNDASDGFGRCRKHAPTMTGYPAVFGTDWCGDHKLDENKI